MSRPLNFFLVFSLVAFSFVPRLGIRVLGQAVPVCPLSKHCWQARKLPHRVPINNGLPGQLNRGRKEARTGATDQRERHPSRHCPGAQSVARLPSPLVSHSAVAEPFEIKIILCQSNRPFLPPSPFFEFHPSCRRCLSSSCNFFFLRLSPHCTLLLLRIFPPRPSSR